MPCWFAMLPSQFPQQAKVKGPVMFRGTEVGTFTKPLVPSKAMLRRLPHIGAGEKDVVD